MTMYGPDESAEFSESDVSLPGLSGGSTISAICGFAVEHLVDRGSVQYPEDTLVINPAAGILAVFDGTSAPYDSKTGPTLYSGNTGGQLVAGLVGEAMMDAGPADSLERIVKSANEMIHSVLKSQGLVAEHPGLLPGVVGAIAKIDTAKGLVHIASWGDCFILSRTRSGGFYGTRNELLFHDAEMKATFAQLVDQHGGDKAKAWNDFFPVLQAKRIERVNKQLEGFGYTFLNGTPEFLRGVRYSTVRIEDLRELALVSDGFIPFDETRDTEYMAEFFFGRYEHGGLGMVLEEIRMIEDAESERSHVQHAEAAGLVIQFAAEEDL